jgi:glycosyltransferase involved in cell wall biosynthesis
LKPKVTIFTQAYNTEEYIEKCIESVLAQTLSDFEYIIVDNGSTDKTKDIIAQYSKKDARIKAVRFEENRRGFWPGFVNEHANGEYFTNLDSDDWLEPTFLEVLVSMADKKNLDVVIGGTCFHFVTTNEISYRKSDTEMVIDNNNIPLYFGFIYQFFRTVWGKIFRTSIVKNADYSDFYSISKTGYGGDTVFCLDALKLSNKIGISNKILHNYLVRPKSTSTEYHSKRADSDTFLFHKAEDYLSQFGKISDTNYEFLYSVYISAIFDTIKVILGSNITTHEKILEIEKILTNEVTQKAFEIIQGSNKLKDFRKVMTELFLMFVKANLSDEKMLDLAYSNICSLNKNIDQYVGYDNFLSHINKPDFILSVINSDEQEMLKDSMYLLKDDVLSNCIWLSLTKIFNSNPILNCISDKGFAMTYSHIIIDIYAKRYFEAMDKILSLLASEDDIPFAEELILLCLKLATEINDSEAYIFAKKLQTNFFIEQKRFSEAELSLSNLFELCPDDNEVLGLKNYLEEEYV